MTAKKTVEEINIARLKLLKNEILISALRAQLDDFPISYMMLELKRINESGLNKVEK